VLFGHRAWCTDGTAIQTDGSFQSLYKQQFGVPVFQRTGIGAPEFDSSSWSTASILSEAAEVYKAFFV
jgi:hypothetical protein